MSRRFPPATTDSTTTVTSTLDVEVQKHHGPNPNFKYKDTDGTPIGPFAVLAYTPELFGPFMMFGDALLHQSSLTLRMRELAILAVAAVHPTPFVTYAHSHIAQTAPANLSPLQTDSACKGVTPQGLNEKDIMTYETARAMAKGVGMINEEEWRRAEGVLGKEMVARIGHVVGFYLYSCSLMRLGEVGVPTAEDIERSGSGTACREERKE